MPLFMGSAILRDGRRAQGTGSRIWCGPPLSRTGKGPGTLLEDTQRQHGLFGDPP